MEHQADQKLDQYDATNLIDSQVLHLGVVEETSRFCSWHLHALLDAASAGGRYIQDFFSFSKQRRVRVEENI